LSGNGRSDFESTANDVTRSVSSPIFERNITPWTPTISPRSTSLNVANASSPTFCGRTKICMRPVRSLTSAKIALPWPRIEMRRPAKACTDASSSPAWRCAKSVASCAAVVVTE
jgi:hypothetical protein